MLNVLKIVKTEYFFDFFSRGTTRRRGGGLDPEVEPRRTIPPPPPSYRSDVWKRRYGIIVFSNTDEEVYNIADKILQHSN